MKVVPFLALVIGVGLSAPGFAADAAVPVEKLNACDQQANQRALRGAERDAFIAQCTAPATFHSVPWIGVIPNELRMGCEQGASARGLAGTGRDAFMNECTAYKNTQALTMPAIPLAKINACDGSANMRGLSGAERERFVHSCLAG